MQPLFAKVCTDLALDREFDYRVPPALAGRIRIGSVVRVPFGRTRKRAFVTALPDTPGCPPERLKDIESVEDVAPLFDERILALARWMADYYLAPLEHAFRAVLPAPVRREGAGFKTRHIASLTDAGLALTESAIAAMERKSPKQAAALRFLRARGPLPSAELLREARVGPSVLKALAARGWLAETLGVVRRDPLRDRPVLAVPPPPLTPDQQAALDAVRAAMHEPSPPVLLLHGVTGSGKTEVYLHAIQSALDEGKGAIALVPEISLTPQTQERFRSRFGETVAVLHSRLSDGERHDEWRRIADGRARVVVGARSALFAPVRPLGLLIVDEEHEPAYKQEESPRYHARDVAVYRGRLESCPVLLGSATPSLESFKNALDGRYRLLRMPRRVDNRTLPEVRIADMRGEVSPDGAPRLFSTALVEAIRERLPRGEQVILFLNRRGYATSLVCAACGQAVACPDCSVNMTYHKAAAELRCHTCGRVAPLPPLCPSCGQPLKQVGTGTQRIEAAVQKLFPHARVARMDADTTSAKDAHDRILAAFRRGDTDILIGTQMIAKGLDFPRVTLVGVVNADASLQLPDFRAAERTFQLLAQVAGRSGRGEIPGEVVFQTRMPSNPVIQAACTEDYPAFYAREIETREAFRQPPFTRMARLLFHGPSDEAVADAAKAFADALQPRLPPSVAILGPAPAPLEKAKGEYRHHLLVRADAGNRPVLPKILRAAIAAFPLPPGVKLTPAIDPQSIV